MQTWGAGGSKKDNFHNLYNIASDIFATILKMVALSSGNSEISVYNVYLRIELLKLALLSIIFHLFIYFFETEYCHVAWIGFELTNILLPQLLNAGLV